MKTKSENFENFVKVMREQVEANVWDFVIVTDNPDPEQTMMNLKDCPMILVGQKEYLHGVLGAMQEAEVKMNKKAKKKSKKVVDAEVVSEVTKAEEVKEETK